MSRSAYDLYASCRRSSLSDASLGYSYRSVTSSTGDYPAASGPATGPAVAEKDSAGITGAEHTPAGYTATDKFAAESPAVDHTADGYASETSHTADPHGAVADLSPEDWSDQDPVVQPPRPAPPSARDLEIFRLSRIEQISTRRLAEQFALSQTRIRQILQRVNEWLLASLPRCSEAERVRQLRLVQLLAADQLQRQIERLELLWDTTYEPKFLRIQAQLILMLVRLGVMPGTLEGLLADTLLASQAATRNGTPPAGELPSEPPVDASAGVGGADMPGSDQPLASESPTADARSEDGTGPSAAVEAVPCQQSWIASPPEAAAAGQEGEPAAADPAAAQEACPTIPTCSPPCAPGDGPCSTATNGQGKPRPASAGSGSSCEEKLSGDRPRLPDWENPCGVPAHLLPPRAVRTVGC